MSVVPAVLERISPRAVEPGIPRPVVSFMHCLAACGVIALFVLSGICRAADPKNSPFRVNRTTVDLFASDQPDAAVGHLQANLPPGTGPDGSATALVHGLIEAANTLHNRHRLGPAREATVRALAAADGIIAGRSSVAVPRRAAVLSALGLLSESVLMDLKRAEDLYSTAAMLEPGNPLHQARKRAVVEKQKPRGRVSGS